MVGCLLNPLDDKVVSTRHGEVLHGCPTRVFQRVVMQSGSSRHLYWDTP